MWVLFVQTKAPLRKISAMKERIRKLFHLGKHSVHISDTNEEALTIARAVLNRNSVRMLHEIPWSSPRTRRRDSPCRSPPESTSTYKQKDIYYLDDKPCVMPPRIVTGIRNNKCRRIPRITKKKYWASIEEMFEALNAANVSYALLRNFEHGVVHPGDRHPDIDILVGELQPACCVITVYGGPEARCGRNVQVGQLEKLINLSNYRDACSIWQDIYTF